MASIPIKDGDGNLVELEINGGTGILADPYQSKTYVEILDASLPVTDNGGSLTVDGTVTVQDGGGSLTVDGTVTIQDGGGSITVDGSFNSVGDTAHDAADSGNPVKVGARAESSLEASTPVADGDRTDLLADLDGQQMVKALCPFGDIITETVSDATGSSIAFTVFGAGGAGIRNYVSTITVLNTSSVTGYVDIKDGVFGAVILRVPTPAGGGCVLSLPVPLRQPTANTALAYDASAALATLHISLIGFQSPI